MNTMKQHGDIFSNTKKRKSIFIVDNNLLNRIKLRDDIRKTGKYIIEGEATYETFSDRAKSINPDIIIFSSFEDLKKNSELLTRTSKDFPLAKQIIVALNPDDFEFLHSFNSGARGYVAQSSGIEKIIDVINDVAEYGAGFDKNLNAFIRRVICATGNKITPVHIDKPMDEQITLTKSQSKTFSAVLNTKSQEEAAELLNISRHTVKKHMSNIYKKTGVSNKYEVYLKIQNQLYISELKKDI